MKTDEINYDNLYNGFIWNHYNWDFKRTLNDSGTVLSKCYFPHTSVKDYETVFTYNSIQYVLYLYIYIYIYLSIISGWGNYTVSVSQNKINDMNVLIICHKVSQFYRFW